jgi:hypothetical protein
MSYKERLRKILDDCEVKPKPSHDTIEALFAIHNETFPKRQEHGKHCGGCRTRVLVTMQNHYGTLS